MEKASQLTNTANICHPQNNHNTTPTSTTAEFNQRNVSFVEKVYRHTANVCIYASSLIYDLFVSIYDRIVSIIALYNHLPLDHSRIDNFLQDSKKRLNHYKEMELDDVNTRGGSFFIEGSFIEYATNKITPLAIKKINKTYSENTEENFRKEVNNLLKVQQDPRFVQIFAVCETKNYYNIMTKAYGVDIQSRIDNLQQKENNLNTNVALYTMFFILDTLKFCIQENLVFDNIQLKNILIGKEGAKHCDLSDAQYYRKITSLHIFQMIEMIINNTFEPLINNTAIKNYYKTTTPPNFSEEERKAFFSKYFESKLKENPEITETCIQDIRNCFMDTDYRFNKDTILLNLDVLASCLDNENLNPSCFITLIDAWINCVKEEYQYKEPILIDIQNFKKY